MDRDLAELSALLIDNELDRSCEALMENMSKDRSALTMCVACGEGKKQMKTFFSVA